MAIDQKYGTVELEHGSIGEFEPVFVLRARDMVSVRAIREYFRLAREEYGVEFSDQHETMVVSEFENWQRDNSVRTPD